MKKNLCLQAVIVLTATTWSGSNAFFVCGQTPRANFEVANSGASSANFSTLPSQPNSRANITPNSSIATEGLIEPFQTVRVAAPESATIAEVMVRQGQVVQKGSPLVQMDIDMLQSALLIAIAKADAQAKLEAASIELDVKQRRVDILKSLGKDNASSEELIRATADFDLAKSALLAAQEERTQNQLEAKRIEMQLEKRTIRSPIDGVVVRVHHKIGEFVTNLDPVVVTVAELNRLRAVIHPSTELAQSLVVDAIVPVRLNDGQVVDTTVDFVSPVIDADSRTVRIELILDNNKGQFRSGSRCWLGVQPSVSLRTREFK